MDKVFCTNCGAENDARRHFCTNCGAELDHSFLHDGLDEEVYAEERVFEATSIPQAEKTSYIPPVAPPPTASAPEPYNPPPRRNGGAGKAVAITLTAVCGVLVAGFLVFYFTNPLGLTDGIFANSAAAQAAAAEEAREQAEAEQQQADLEQAQAEAEQAQKEAEEAQKAQAEAEQKQKEAEEAQKKAEEESGRKSSSSSSSSGPTINGIEFVHHTNPAPSSQYILPDSADRTYTTDELEGFSNYELYLARNEIFARYGRTYIEDDLNSHFNSTDWYMPLYERKQFDEVAIEDYLNEHEYQNAIIIRDLERSRGSEYVS